MVASFPSINGRSTRFISSEKSGNKKVPWFGWIFGMHLLLCEKKKSIFLLRWLDVSHMTHNYCFSSNMQQFVVSWQCVGFGTNVSMVFEPWIENLFIVLFLITNLALQIRSTRLVGFENDATGEVVLWRCSVFRIIDDMQTCVHEKIKFGIYSQFLLE